MEKGLDDCAIISGILIESRAVELKLVSTILKNGERIISIDTYEMGVQSQKSLTVHQGWKICWQSSISEVEIPQFKKKSHFSNNL